MFNSNNACAYSYMITASGKGGRAVLKLRRRAVESVMKLTITNFGSRPDSFATQSHLEALVTCSLSSKSYSELAHLSHNLYI